MSNYDEILKQNTEMLPNYVQPRYKQERETVLAQLNRMLLTRSGSYPQLVDPSIIEVGDEITVVRAIETKPLWKATIVRITPLLCRAADVVFDMTQPERIEAPRSDPLPTQRKASELGFAELTYEGVNLSDDYFSYTHVFLTGIARPLGPKPPEISTVGLPATTLRDGWWGWDV